MIKVIISDFDGTVTDPAVELNDFMEQYLRDVALLTDLSFERVRDIARFVYADMRTHPTRYDWEFAGNLVCSAVGDPYLRIIPIANAILDEAAARTTITERHDLLRGLLSKHHPMTSVFRSGAMCYLTELGVPTHVVTNTKTDKAAHRLSGLFVGRQAHLEIVLGNLRGDAGKQIIDPSFDELPASTMLHGFHRPVLLRRHQYFQVLDEVRRLYGAGWDEMLVVGDNFELDLVVPYALGAHIALMTNKNTPPWEIEFVRQSSQGSVITSLDEVSALLHR